MHCERARELMSEASYDAAGAEPELRAHLAQCAACRAVHAQHAALDRVLALDEPAVARPGFDTRFFARLEQEKAGLQRARARRRFVWALLPLCAGAAAALLVTPRPAPVATPAPQSVQPDALSASTPAPEIEPDDLSLAMDLELVEDIDVVQKLDELEDFDVLSQVDADELERMAKEPK
jgi:predicted anti-sigma-YlaC factor YlaD